MATRKDFPKAYHAWKALRDRCFNPRNKDYCRWGGRGITVCERWNNFDNFIEDMGPPPTSVHSIGRIDNDGNYEPSNCRWELPYQQNRNRSCIKLNEAKAMRIRCLAILGFPQRWIGEAFGVTQTTVSEIFSHEKWGDHVPRHNGATP